MRPINRRDNPTGSDFDNYRDAYAHLVGRIGKYCSYCERYIETNLAVEHIQPKGLSQYEHLKGTWENFLLGCVNCNSTKLDKDVHIDRYCLPDRDNTFVAYEYTADGKVEPTKGLSDTELELAWNTLRLTGLDKRVSQVHDENGKLIVIDRVSKRMEIMAIAQEALGDLINEPTDALRRWIVTTATMTGGFSIWMKVFEQDIVMRQRFIDGFIGTSQDCFDDTTQPVSPRPDNGLPHACKI